MNLKELETKIENLEEQIRTLQDIEQIKLLQKAYGYYMDNLMPDDAADLFTDDAYAAFLDVYINGRENIRKSFRNMMTHRPEDGKRQLFVHMQLQGVVHIDQGGKTAKGRWQMFDLSTDFLGKPPGELSPIIEHGVYENEYAKENDIWKIKRSIFVSSFICTLQNGWVKETDVERTWVGTEQRRADLGDRTWRSGYKVPCHFKNPVTGK